MDIEQKDKLIKFIIRYQYVLAYNYITPFSSDKFKSTILGNKNIKQWVLEIPELLKRVDTVNLLMLALKSADDPKNIVLSELVNRSKNDAAIAYGGIIENRNYLGVDSPLYIFLQVLERDNKLADKILQGESRIKNENPRLWDILNKSKSLMTKQSLLESSKKGNITNETLNFLESLVEDNPHIIDYMDMRILELDISSLNREFLNRVVRYRNQSVQLVDIYLTNPDFFKIFTSKIDEWENTLSMREATKLEAAVLEKYVLYAPLICDIKPEEFDDVLDFCLKVNVGDIYEEEIQKYESGMSDYCKSVFDDIINKKTVNAYYTLLKIYCIQILGISYMEVKKIFSRKFANINYEQIRDPRLKEYIKCVQDFISLDMDEQEDFDNLYNLYINAPKVYSARDAVSFIEQADTMFLETYKKPFNDTKKKIEESADIELLEVNGKKIRQINMIGEFSALIRSTDSGFSTEKTVETNYVDLRDESNSPPSPYIKSCVYYTESFTGIAPLGENGIYTVYLENDENNMGEIGNGDLNSNFLGYGVISDNSKSFTSDTITDNSRQAYIETTKIGTCMPDALALFDDSTDRQKELTMQTAAKYGLDILYFDKTAIVYEQIQRLEDMKLRFTETKNLDDLAKLISRFETNVAGWLLNRDESNKNRSQLFISIDNSRFLSRFNEMETSIYKIILDFCKESVSKQPINQIVAILRTEQAKYDSVIRSEKLPKVKMKFRAQELIEYLNQKYELGLNIEPIEQELIEYKDANSRSLLFKIIEQELYEGATYENLENGRKLIKSIGKEKKIH